MRHRLTSSILALLIVLAFSSVLFAQTTESRAALAESAVSTPDLHGVWKLQLTAALLKNDASALAFSKDEPPMQPWAEAKYKAYRPTFGPNATSVDSDDPTATMSCLPPGIPRIYLIPFPMEIIQIPGRVIMLFEYDHFVRQIYTDGRDHPKDLSPTWMGGSIGRWEGDTLIVDTIGFNGKTSLDRVGHPQSGALHLVERIRRVDHDTLEHDLTFDDPKAYTKPWTAQVIYELKPTWNIMEYSCEDNATFLEFQRKAAKGPSK